MRDTHLLAAGANRDDMMAVLDALIAVSTEVEVSFTWRPALRDVTDEMVLEAAVAGGAECLLTFNLKDFRGAERFGINVLTPGDGLAVARRKGVAI